MDARPYEIAAPASAHRWTVAEVTAAALCIAIAALLCIFARRSANADMLSYIGLARHWLDGRPDLAVSGTWSPLFSWLLVPALTLIPDPILAARVVHAGTGVLFFLSGLVLLRRVLPADMVGTAALALATYAAVRSGTLITPDLLSAALFALYCRVLLDVADQGRPRQALGAGALLGMCYLAKAATLITGLAAGALLLGYRVLAGRRVAPARAAGLFTILLAGTLLVGGSWMAALTFKYGRPTISTAGKAAFAFIGPEDQDRRQPLDRLYVVPEPGRRSQFEDESILPQASWSPLQSRSYAVWYARRIVDNLEHIVGHLGSFDAFRLGLSSAAWGLVLLAWRRRQAAAPWQEASLLALPAALAYAPVFADQQRYYYVIYPLLLCAAFGFGVDVLAPLLPRRAISLVVVSSFLFALGASVPELGPAQVQEQVYVDFGRAVAPDLRAAGFAGPVADAGPWAAPYLSFFLDTPFYGGNTSPTPEQAAASCARLIVTRRGTEPDRALAASPLFRSLDTVVPVTAGTRWQIFENLKGRNDCPPGPTSTVSSNHG